MRNNHERPWWEQDQWLRDKLLNDPVLTGLFKRVRGLQVSPPEEEQLLFWREVAKYKTEKAQEYFDEMVNLRMNGLQPAPIVVPEGSIIVGEHNSKEKTNV